MLVSASNPSGLKGTSARDSRPSATSSRRTSRAARTRRRLLRLRPRREGRRSLGRHSQQGDRRAVGTDTMVVVYSATKGLAAMTMALAHSRGWLDYEERVCAYWPEFAQQGKERDHRAPTARAPGGLFAFDEPVDRERGRRSRSARVVLARQKPAWEPGTRQAYHAITLGFYEGELLRRVDPQHRSLGQFFQDEIATPLGLDIYIRLPESIPNSHGWRMLAPPSRIEMLFGFSARLDADTMNRRSNIYRALVANPGCGAGRAARVRAQPRGAVRRRRRHGARDRARLQRLCHRRPRARLAPGDVANCWRRRRSRRRAASTTSA